MSERADVLVVGAGPAGLAAGMTLAGGGRRVIVADARALPADKPCGEGIMPTGVAHLRALGVERHLRPGAAFPFAGIRYHTDDGAVAGARFAEGPGWGMRRLDLAAAMLACAERVEGVEVRERAPVTELERTEAGIVARVGGHRVQARLVVGADGLASRVRRWAGLEGAARGGFERVGSLPSGLARWGVRRHFAVEPWSDHVEVHFSPGVEAYVTPCGGGRVNVAMLWDAGRVRVEQKGERLIGSLIERFPKLEARLRGAEASDAPRAVGPLARVATGQVADGVLLVGDAGGYLDAITGEGISLAMAEVDAMRATVVPVLRRGRAGASPAVRDLAAYEWRYREIVAPYYRLTKLLLWLARHPALARRAIAALGRQPDVFQHLLSANMGLVSPWAIGPVRAARLLGAMVAARPPTRAAAVAG